jgi:hypothetical protein
VARGPFHRHGTFFAAVPISGFIRDARREQTLGSAAPRDFYAVAARSRCRCAHCLGLLFQGAKIVDCHGVSIRLLFLEPCPGAPAITENAAALGVGEPQRVLSIGVTVLRCLLEPMERLPGTDGRSAPLVVHGTEVELATAFAPLALFCRKLKA